MWVNPLRPRNWKSGKIEIPRPVRNSAGTSRNEIESSWRGKRNQGRGFKCSVKFVAKATSSAEPSLKAGSMTKAESSERRIQCLSACRRGKRGRIKIPGCTGVGPDDNSLCSSPRSWPHKCKCKMWAKVDNEGSKGPGAKYLRGCFQ